MTNYIRKIVLPVLFLASIVLTGCEMILAQVATDLGTAIVAGAVEGGPGQQLDEDELRTLAEEGDLEAANQLAEDYDELKPLKTLAAQGNREATFSLARRFSEPESLRKLATEGDRQAVSELARVGDLSYLETLAIAGDRNAAFELARLGKLSYLEALARQYDTEAAFKMYFIHERIFLPPREHAWGWLCIAANQHHKEAQMEMGDWHRPDVWHFQNERRTEVLRESGLRPDYRVAYMWYTLAASNGDDAALVAREYIAKEMSNSEIAEAEQLAENWKPTKCPSP